MIPSENLAQHIAVIYSGEQWPSECVPGLPLAFFVCQGTECAMLQVLARSLGLTIILAAAARSAVLVDFQVAQPPPLPTDAEQCTVLILE